MNKMLKITQFLIICTVIMLLAMSSVIAPRNYDTSNCRCEFTGPESCEQGGDIYSIGGSWAFCPACVESEYCCCAPCPDEGDSCVNNKYNKDYRKR